MLLIAAFKGKGYGKYSFIWWEKYVMYGEITGKIALSAVIVLLCLARIALLLHNRRQGNEQQGVLSVIIRIAIPVLVAVLVWRILWH